MAGALELDEPLAEELALSPDEQRPRWEGVLGLEGVPTSDKRMLISGEISERDLPLPLMVQTKTAEGHDGAENAGRIESIQHIPLSEFDRAAEFGLDEGGYPDNAIVIFGEGSFDGSDASDEAQRLIENGAGVSLDVPRERLALFDPENLEEIETEGMDPIQALMGDYIQGFSGKIAGATIVTIPAFESASVKMKDAEGALVAAGMSIPEVWRDFGSRLILVRVGTVLTASAGPLKPPKFWFSDPKLKELTPFTITKEGRVYGHLADWRGCHIGFQGVCVPPFRSKTKYAFFHTGEIETAEGDLLPCGKVMFSRTGAGHAPTDRNMAIREVGRYYDDATKVGAFVRVGEDQFGIWMAGALRSDLNDLEVQHMRTHGPSGDWRPYKRTSELVAAFCVPIQGFPIRRALVASANGAVSAIISAPLHVSDGYHSRYVRRKMLAQRLRQAIGAQPKEKSQIEITTDRLRTRARKEAEIEELAFEEVRREMKMKIAEEVNNGGENEG
jgi:hypothetical protein